MANMRRAGQTNNTTLIIGGIVLLVLVLVVGWWFFNRNTEETDMDADLFLEEELATPTPTPTPTATPLSSPSVSAGVTTSPLVSGSPAASVKSFSVAATNFAFTPKEIRVKAGDTVRVTLTNNGTMPHDWKVDAFNAATKVITNGQTDTVQFVASKAGTYEYYCSVGTHRQMGMVGTLIVE